MNILYHPSKKCNINYSILNVDLVTGIVDYKIISGNLPISVELIGTNTYTNNHSAFGTYQFSGVASGDYILKITDHKNCTKQESISQCTSCPEGYSPVGSKCVTISEVTPNFYTPTFTIVKAVTNVLYSRKGALIFSSWNFNGTGIAEQFGLSPLNTYWANAPYPAGTTLGRLNQMGVWANVTYGGQTVGFSFCFNVEKGKILYVGFGIDNYGSIKINGELVLQQDNVAITGQFGFGCLEAWFIYPIYFPEGNNVIEIYGTNLMPTQVGNVAAIGAVIYDATKADLIAATSDASLGAKILWKSTDVLGNQAVYEKSEEHGYHGYTCPEGYAINDCGETVVCQLKETIDCPE
ncbi:MAG: hypothetical protein WAV01_02015 [Candidatus Saccharimonadales bacterium]